MAESIGIEIFADTSRAGREVDKLDKKVEGVGKSSVTAGRKLKEGFSKAKIAVTAINAALAATAVVTAKMVAENQNLARQTGVAVSRFKELEFAAKQYSVTGEQLADISKDIADKTAEFIKDGTGAFGDLVSTLRLTTEEGKQLADQMQALSGPDAIQLAIKRMEEAGVTAKDMTFALESLGNDLSRLQPLFANNGAQVDRLTKSYKDANDALELTASQQKGLKELSTSFDLLTGTAANAFTKLISSIAPIVTDLFGGLIAVIPKATEFVIGFTDSINELFNNVDQISEKGIEERVSRDKDALIESEKAFKSLNAQYIAFIETNRGQLDGKQKSFIKQLGFDVGVAERKYNDLLAVAEKFEEQQAAAAESKKQEVLSTFTTAGADAMGHVEAREAELKAQDEHNQKLIEQEILHADEMWQLRDDFLKDRAAQQIAANDMTLQAERDTNDALVSIGKVFAKEGTALSKALFLVEKGIAISRIITDTQVQAAKAGAQLGVAAPPAIAAIEARGAASIALVAAQTGAGLAGARASGGEVQGSNQYRVGEIGPEIFTDRSGRSLLIPGPEGGTVSPIKEGKPQGSMNVVINNNAPATEVKTRQNGLNLEIIIEKVSEAVRGEFVQSVSSGYGDYAEAMTGSFNLGRRFG